MRTSIEFPDSLFREAKATAARRGQSLKDFITEAVRNTLAAQTSHQLPVPSWMQFFGAASDKALSRHLDEVDACVRRARQRDVRMQEKTRS